MCCDASCNLVSYIVMFEVERGDFAPTFVIVTYEVVVLCDGIAPTFVILSVVIVWLCLCVWLVLIISSSVFVWYLRVYVDT